MASSSTKLKDEDKNFIRLQLLLKRIATEAVRESFAHTTTLNSDLILNATLKKEKTRKAADLRRNRTITSHQWPLLYPKIGGADPLNFDLTLMFLLLRNFGNLGEPATFKWDILPPQTDIKPFHDMARIKYYRNMIAHSNSGISDADYTIAWIDVSDAILRLVPVASYGQYQNEIDDLESIPIDEDNGPQLLEELRNDLDLQIHLSELQSTADDTTNNLHQLIQNVQRLHGVLKDVGEEIKSIKGSKEDKKTDQTKQECLERNTDEQTFSNPDVLNQMIKNLKKLYKCKSKKLKYNDNTSEMFDVTSVLYKELEINETPLEIRCTDSSSDGAPNTNATPICDPPNTSLEISRLFTEEVNPEMLPVFVEADAGVGKTTLFHKLALDWANDTEDMKHFKFVFLIPLRAVSSPGLAEIICDDLKLIDPLLKNQLKVDLKLWKSDILLLIDGLDEVTLSPESDIIQLITACYPEQYTICSSRPVLSKDRYYGMKNFLLVKLLGFSDNTIQKYIQCYFEQTNTELDTVTIAKEIMDECRKHFFCKSLMRIPLYSGLLCYLWKQKTQTFPETATQLFNKFLKEVVNSYGSTYLNITVFKEDFKNPLVRTTPVPIRRLLKAIAEMAYQTLVEEKHYMCSDDLDKFDVTLEEINQIGLFSVDDEHIEFRHKLFHEYFAGLYLTLHKEEMFLLFHSWKYSIINRTHVLQNAFFFAAGFCDVTFEIIVCALSYGDDLVEAIAMLNDIKNKDIDEKIVFRVETHEISNLQTIAFLVQLLFEHSEYEGNEKIVKSFTALPVHCSSVHSLCAVLKLLEDLETYLPFSSQNWVKKSIVLIDGPTIDTEQMVSILRECCLREDFQQLTLYNAGKSLVREVFGMTWKYVERIGFDECEYVASCRSILYHFPKVKFIACGDTCKSFLKENSFTEHLSKEVQISTVHCTDANRSCSPTPVPVHELLNDLKQCSYHNNVPRGNNCSILTILQSDSIKDTAIRDTFLSGFPIIGECFHCNYEFSPQRSSQLEKGLVFQQGMQHIHRFDDKHRVVFVEGDTTEKIAEFESGSFRLFYTKKIKLKTYRTLIKPYRKLYPVDRLVFRYANNGFIAAILDEGWPDVKEFKTGNSSFYEEKAELRKLMPRLQKVDFGFRKISYGNNDTDAADEYHPAYHDDFESNSDCSDDAGEMLEYNDDMHIEQLLMMCDDACVQETETDFSAIDECPDGSGSFVQDCADLARRSLKQRKRNLEF